MRALLDVNVLVALLDASHVHHRAARGWLAAHAQQGWASCPLTQNGCLRILSLPSYPNPQPAAAVALRLGLAVADASHAFWPDDCSLLDAGRIRWDHVLGSRQITDAYLLALATEHGGRLVTLDRGVAVQAVSRATARNLVTLSAA
jgi:toxin-antitoxin system PIN domain toxin